MKRQKKSVLSLKRTYESYYGEFLSVFFIFSLKKLTKAYVLNERPLSEKNPALVRLSASEVKFLVSDIVTSIWSEKPHQSEGL